TAAVPRVRSGIPYLTPTLSAPQGRRGGWRAVLSGLGVAGGRLLVLVEVELDLGAARVEEKQLPDAAAGEPTQLIVDVAALQFLDCAGQILGAERHVVEHTGAVALRQVIAVDHVQYRR